MQGVPVVRFQAVRDDDFKDHPISVRFIKTEPVQLILLLILFIALQDWHFIPWAVFGGILAWILYLFVYPLRRRDDGYRQKLRAQDAADDRFNGFNARINSLLRRGYYGPASVAIATLFGAYYAGTYWALQTRNFPVVTPSNPPLVVLRVYGDTLIARRLQADQHSLGGEIVVWRLGETRLVLERRDFGSLRVAD
jgi:hypothetical protein